MNETKNVRFLIHGYMLFTALGLILLFPATRLAIYLFTIGAESIYVSLVYFFSADVSFWGHILAGLWGITFPICLIISYFLALKNKYRMFFIFTIADIVSIILWVVHTTITGHASDLYFALCDIGVSVAYAALLGYCIYNAGKANIHHTGSGSIS